MLDELLRLLFVWGVCGCVMMGVHQYFDWWKQPLVCLIFGAVFALLINIIIPLPYWLFGLAALLFTVLLMWVGRHTNPHYRKLQIKFNSEFESIDFEEVAE